MTCSICDMKSANCDCTEGEKVLFGQLEESEQEVQELKDLLDKALRFLKIGEKEQWKLYQEICQAIGIKK